MRFILRFYLFSFLVILRVQLVGTFMLSLETDYKPDITLRFRPSYILLFYFINPKQFTSKMEENSPHVLQHLNQNELINQGEQVNDAIRLSIEDKSHKNSLPIVIPKLNQQKMNIYDEQEEQVQKLEVKTAIHKEKKSKDKKLSVLKPQSKTQAKNVQKSKKEDKENQKRIGFVSQLQDEIMEPIKEEKTQRSNKHILKHESISKEHLDENHQSKKQIAPIQSNFSTPTIKSLKSINGNEQQFERASRKTRQTFRSSRSSCEDYLGHIFNFYCKLSYPIGKDPTFDEISEKVKIMAITNFMAFCRDFKLREHFTRQNLVEAFKKNSSFHKYLNPEQFHAAIEDLAQKMYQNYEEDRRFGKMLVFLQIHNSYSFVRKMNELGVVFRMKNKRGKQVRIAPKYTFKLTPNNGKSEQQIALEVKERLKFRKILKQEQIEWHRKNKLNKIDELYKKGTKISKNIKKPSCESTKQEKTYQNYINHTQKESFIKENNRGYYNPCQIFSMRTDESTYKKVNEMKKILSISKLKQQKSDRSLGNSQYQVFPLDRRKMKVNQVIEMAKNSIMQDEKLSEQEGENWKSKQHGFIKRQNLAYSYSNESANSRYIPRSTAMKEVTNKVNIIIPRKSKQINQAETMIESQLKNISRIISEGEVRPKQFLRATAKLQRDNIQEMVDLQEITGANEQDNILVQHFAIEKKYEENLSKTHQNKSGLIY